VKETTATKGFNDVRSLYTHFLLSRTYVLLLYLFHNILLVSLRASVLCGIISRDSKVWYNCIVCLSIE
jgi:hypothetical protein